MTAAVFAAAFHDIAVVTVFFASVYCGILVNTKNAKGFFGETQCHGNFS